MTETIEAQQKAMCAGQGVAWVPAHEHLKVGVARNVKSGLVPINGLRIRPEGDTTGWYIWAGEGDPQAEPDFFEPLHVHHLASWRPGILRFLGLPPGWRFLTDGEYDDVWEDSNLLRDQGWSPHG